MSEECTFVLNLPPERREEIRRELNRMLILDGNRYRKLIDIMGGVIGRKVSDTARYTIDVWARTMCAYQMVKEGFTHSEIGRQMGKDHSSVTYFKHKMDDVLEYPQAFKDIIPYWNEFQKRLGL